MPTARIGAEAEREPPAPGRVDDGRVEQRDRQQRAGRGADPEGAVDRDVDAAAVLRRDQLVDGGVDGGVLTADAHAGQEPGAEVPQRRHRERRQHGGGDVDAERDQEELLAAEPVGELTEEQRADARAGDVHRAGQTDVEAAQPEPGVARLQRLRHRPDDRDLEPVEDPHGPEPDHDHPVPPRPRQPVEPGRDVGGDASCLCSHAGCRTHARIGACLTATRIETERLIAAPAADIFALLCDPQGHVAVDSSGMLQDATGEPVTAAGDSFVVHMDRESLNDFPEMGKYDVTVTIRDFEPDRLISWTILGRIRPQIGHVYGYRLEPDRTGRHPRHVVLRLVRHPPGLAGRRDLPGDLRERPARQPRHPGPHGPARLPAPS